MTSHEISNENHHDNQEANLDAAIERLIVQQRSKVLRIARELVPGATIDDILNPHDFPALAQSAYFNFEDGILAGYISAGLYLKQLRERN